MLLVSRPEPTLYYRGTREPEGWPVAAMVLNGGPNRTIGPWGWLTKLWEQLKKKLTPLLRYSLPPLTNPLRVFKTLLLHRFCSFTNFLPLHRAGRHQRPLKQSLLGVGHKCGVERKKTYRPFHFATFHTIHFLHLIVRVGLNVRLKKSSW